MRTTLLATAVLLHAATSTAGTAQTAGTWQSLFDGQTLEGWHEAVSHGTFRVEDGAIVGQGPRGVLYYAGPVADHDFTDFELELEVMTFPQSNSGVFFHTPVRAANSPRAGYEVQIDNSHRDPVRTGSLYDVVENLESVAADKVWFTLRIVVRGKRVRTFVDDRQVVDYTEEENVKRPPSRSGRVLGHGTFALQGHDPESRVCFRNIRVRVLP